MPRNESPPMNDLSPRAERWPLIWLALAGTLTIAWCAFLAWLLAFIIL
jgi:hypothetical protein